MTIVNNKIESSESAMEFFNEEVIGYGENGIIIYPNLQSFRQIYTKYAKEQLEKEDNGNGNSIRNEQSKNQESSLLRPFTKRPTA